MDRSFSSYPADENGDVLWEIVKMAGELPDEAVVRFAMLFATFDEALKFGVFLLRHEYRVKVNEIDDKPGYFGEVLVDILLDINHTEITNTEQWLAEKSSSLGGKNDGWEIQPERGSLIASEWRSVAA